MTVKASRLLVLQLKGCHAADFARSIAVAVTEHHTITCLPPFHPCSLMGEPGQLVSGPSWLSFDLSKLAKPSPLPTSGITALPSSLLPLDSSPKTPDFSKNRQPFLTGHCRCSLPSAKHIDRPRDIHALTQCTEECVPSLPGAQQAPSLTPYILTPKPQGKPEALQGQQDLNFADAPGDADWAALQTAETNKWQRLHFPSAQPQARSPAQDTEGASETRDSHELSHSVSFPLKIHFQLCVL